MVRLTRLQGMDSNVDDARAVARVDAGFTGFMKEGTYLRPVDAPGALRERARRCVLFELVE